VVDIECPSLRVPQPAGALQRLRVLDDLRQGLRLLAGFLERAEYDLQAGKTNEARPRLRLAARVATSLSSIAAGSAPGAPIETRVPIDLRQMLHDVARLTAPIWGRHAETLGRAIALSVEAPPGLQIEGEPQRVRSSLISVVVSAVNALPAGGEISLTAQQPGQSVLLDVRAQSREGQESATRLSFPVSQAAGRRLRILVVVDAAPALGRLMIIILTRAGHLVEAVASAEEALASLQHSAVDVVIADVWLDRRLACLDLAAAVRERWPQVRFVAMTASARDLTSLDQPSLGIDAVLEKPFSPTGLRELVAQLTPSDVDLADPDAGA
jgi:CheY-like chemotaxis protein